MFRSFYGLGPVDPDPCCAACCSRFPFWCRVLGFSDTWAGFPVFGWKWSLQSPVSFGSNLLFRYCRSPEVSSSEVGTSIGGASISNRPEGNNSKWKA